MAAVAARTIRSEIILAPGLVVQGTIWVSQNSRKLRSFVDRSTFNVQRPERQSAKRGFGLKDRHIYTTTMKEFAASHPNP